MAFDAAVIASALELDFLLGLATVAAHRASLDCCAFALLPNMKVLAFAAEFAFACLPISARLSLMLPKEGVRDLLAVSGVCNVVATCIIIYLINYLLEILFTGIWVEHLICE